MVTRRIPCSLSRSFTSAGRGPLSPLELGTQAGRDANLTRRIRTLYTVTREPHTPRTHLTRTRHVLHPTPHTPHTHKTHATRTHTPHVLRTLHAPRALHHLTPHPATHSINTRTTHTHTHTHTHTPLLGTWTPEDTSPKQAPPAGPAPTSTSEGTARSRVEPLPAHAQQTGAPVPFVIGGQRIPWPPLQLDFEGHLRDGAAPWGAYPQAGRSARWPRTPHSSSRPEAP